uniref:Uncharacterized protein n=1 Tax=Zea mays TaxID=4577 RepID=C0HHR6_MAIZE|nr:unknown [Zea mays]
MERNRHVRVVLNSKPVPCRRARAEPSISRPAVRRRSARTAHGLTRWPSRPPQRPARPSRAPQRPARPPRAPPPQQQPRAQRLLVLLLSRQRALPLPPSPLQPPPAPAPPPLASLPPPPRGPPRAQRRQLARSPPGQLAPPPWPRRRGQPPRARRRAEPGSPPPALPRSPRRSGSGPAHTCTHGASTN